MKTEANHVVSISYRLTEYGSDEVVELVTGEDPFVFLMGTGHLLEAFERSLTGLEVGQPFDFVLSSHEAYGEIQQEAIVKIPVDAFMINGKFADDVVVVGQPVRMQDQAGNPLVGMVLERGLDTVTIDFNHPMAGKTLHFIGEVVSVRPATNEELEHGHVHGPGGHHH
ncbi:MAG: FKBP-type peptidyl-prolyl cis-trans isomerase [Flavobacteriales bacterium]|nr:FKBP-type peptidyl-prolyl cis-trans isomerase [Flavobacteriales bacterium]MCZ2443467.1 FKBP-type peptidyl-prolyl cis-trans isomerase [Flavobacteriales bacterium]